MSDSINNDDWRLQGQDRYLANETLRWCKWYPSRPDWDHDHCEFCNTKFSAAEDSAVLHEGYATDDAYRWVCEKCAKDFARRLKLTLVGGPQTMSTTSLGRRFLGCFLYLCAALLGLLALLMLIAACRWLVLELVYGWPLSLSLALFGGSALTFVVSAGLVWLASLTRRCRGAS